MSQSWYHGLSFERTKEEDDAFSEIGQNWQCQGGIAVADEAVVLYGTTDLDPRIFITQSSNEKYPILYAQRYPKHSRDYTDDGFYVELVGNVDLVLVCVCVYDWNHCSYTQWDDYLDFPNKIYRFSDYIKEMKLQARLREDWELVRTPLSIPIRSNVEDDELYAFREIVLYYSKYVQPKEDRKLHLSKMTQVQSELLCSPPSNLLENGGKWYQQSKCDFDQKRS